MSFFDDASLVMIPSGYKDQKVYSVKPIDGTGDLTFTRSNDTATRVNSSGLIEKVRTNVILQSNTFDTTWGTTDLTVTSGATDPNGGSTAWTIANTAASGIIQQSATLDGLRSVSIYAKAGTHRYLYMGAYVGSGTQSYQVFDLQDGVITSGTLGRIESIGGGWHRCTSYGADGTTGGVQILPSNVSTGAATTNGSILIWKCQYEAGDIATDYIATTSAAVSVGPVANLPRLDYSGGATCGKLLLEPQRTNVNTFSEQMDNASYTKNGYAVTANSGISPDGYQNADLVYQTVSGDKDFYTTIPSTTGTFSVYAKAAGKNWFYITDLTGANPAYYNISNGTLGTVASGTEATITSMGNNWYRLTYYRNQAGGYQFFKPVDIDNSQSSMASGTDGALIWGAQVEAGSYATSYINTLSAAVTRGADACSKTGISSLIGQTEGTIFYDLIASSYNSDGTIYSLLMTVGDGASNFQLYTTNSLLSFNITASGVVDKSTGITLINGNRYKIALAYKSGDCAVYVNGVLTNTSTKSVMPAASALYLNQFSNGTYKALNYCNQALLFKTRLSNADLATLTTI